MFNFTEKYKDEINFIKRNYQTIRCSEERLGVEIAEAIQLIENFTHEKYDEQKHFPAVVKMVLIYREAVNYGDKLSFLTAMFGDVKKNRCSDWF